MTEQAFLDYVQSGGQVEAGDWMPDDYRAKLIKFIEMHGNSELMGVLPEREWILRAPTLQRKLALTAKVQDEVGHAQLIYRVVEDLGKPREACLDDLVSGRAKFHNVFHYPTKTWGDVGVIAWLISPLRHATGWLGWRGSRITGAAPATPGCSVAMASPLSRVVRPALRSPSPRASTTSSRFWRRRPIAARCRATRVFAAI